MKVSYEYFLVGMSLSDYFDTILDDFTMIIDYYITCQFKKNVDSLKTKTK